MEKQEAFLHVAASREAQDKQRDCTLKGTQTTGERPMRLFFAVSIPTQKAETLTGRVLREDHVVLKRMKL
nr:unnamed protein product [Callosobruchus chinensis]